MYSNAVQSLESAVKQEATPLRQYHLAMAYAKVGKKVKAEEVFQAAEKGGATLPEARTARQLLAQLK
jgi:hypothetical protein